MRSTTKSDVDRPVIAALVRHQFGQSVKTGEILPLTDGWFNTAYSVEFLDGHPDVVLRVAPDPEMRLLSYERALMRSEVKTYELVQQEPAVPVPRLCGYNFDRDIIGRDCMFITRLSGTPLDKAMEHIDRENLDSIQHELGTMTARIHAIKGDGFGYVGREAGEEGSGWEQTFLEMVFSVLDDGAALSVELPIPCEEIRALFRDRGHVLSEIRQPSLVHWDLWPPNIFVVRDRGRYVIEGITDWERAYWGDPESESIMATESQGEAFYGGYGRQLTPGGAAATRRCMYRIYLWLVMVIEARIRFEDAPHLGRAYSALEKDLLLLRGHKN